MENQFEFIQNDDLRKVFINAYNNESTTNYDPINDWAKNKIKKINDECWTNFVENFNEEKLLEEYNEMNNEPITIRDGEINVPIRKSGGKRKTRKTRKSGKKTMRKTRKSRRKTRKSKKSKK